MANIDLNIVSFDVPYPANYGGVIDVYYKLKALHRAGLKIALHVYKYGRSEQSLLEEFCEVVYYYPRAKSVSLLFSKYPYVVATRSSRKLEENLRSNSAPVLFEGLHTCYPMLRGLGDRQCIIRMHNIESDYYAGLAKVESNPFKRYYFKQESKKLSKFEGIVNKACDVLAISKADYDYLSAKYKDVTCTYVPAFHSSEYVDIKEGKGDYAFYHGNLAVGENNEAALFLVNQVFSNCNHNLVIAGNKPSKELRAACKGHSNIELLDNLSSDEITQYLSNAQCNVLPTFQATGIKLKLILSLYRGRHCIANNEMALDTGLETLCTLANTSQEWIIAVNACFSQAFEASDIDRRKQFLSDKFSNDAGAARIIDLLKTKG